MIMPLYPVGQASQLEAHFTDYRLLMHLLLRLFIHLSLEVSVRLCVRSTQITSKQF